MQQLNGGYCGHHELFLAPHAILVYCLFDELLAWLLFTLRRRSPSELASYQQKVFRIDDHLGIALSGLTADGRTLCKYMRGECMSHSFVYESALQTERLVVDVADKHQKATQSYVRRPFGVGLLVAGHDRTGPHLYQTSPSGNYYEWQAYALGARSQSAKTYLEKNLENFAGCTSSACCARSTARRASHATTPLH